MKSDINSIDELQEAYTAELLLNGEIAERIKELEKKYDKATTQLVSYEATIGYLKEALEFYGNKAHWSSYGSSLKNEFIHPDDHEDISGNSCGMAAIGGKRARECLKGLKK